MAGRVILIALGCAISGLLITVFKSSTGSVPAVKKPWSSSSFSTHSGAIHTGSSRTREAVERFTARNGPGSHNLPEAENRNKPGMISAWWGGRNNEHDPGLLMSVESVRKGRQSREGVLIVDVRDHKAFQACHIPGSLNVPLYALRTKKFLETTILVLVNNGFPCTHLEERCLQLRDAGFLVWVLEGGLNAWREAGAPLEGAHLPGNDLNELTPQELFQERDHDGWMAVDVRRAPDGKATLPFGRIVTVNSPEDAEEFRSALVKSLTRPGKHAPLFPVVFNEDGKQYDILKKAIWKAGIKNAFYLKDGLEGYRAFLTRQTAILKKEEPFSKGSGKCPGCS